MNYRHGDINFIPSTIEKSFKKVGGSGFVLAEGETTGHHHVITATEGKVMVYEGPKGELAIKVNGKAVLTHPEHKTIEVPTGTYMVTREREKDWFSLSVRRVID